MAEQGVMMVVEGGGDKTIGFKDLWLIRMWDPQVLAHVVWKFDYEVKKSYGKQLVGKMN